MFEQPTTFENVAVYICILAIPFGFVKIGELVYTLLSHLTWVN